jgi:hypothetical protein
VRSTFIALAAAGGVWLLLAGVALSSGVAHASTDTFISQLQSQEPNMVARYGASALIDEGNKVCGWEAQSIPDDEPGGVVDRIKADLPMSDMAAIALKDTAESELGC